MASPYEGYLDTNFAPTVDEAREILAIVEDSAKEIAELNAQVNTLQKQLDRLHEKREKIRIFSNRHRALLSPIRQLTRDILEEIFIACLPMGRNPCMSATEAPMFLTRICSSWRQISLSTPRLWAKIHIPLPVIQVGQYAGEKDLVVQEEQLRGILKLRETAVIEWLDRSYACPLSISIYQTRGWSQPELSEKYYAICEDLRELHVSFMRNTIFRHHKRWWDLDIYAADDTLCGFLDLGLTAESLQMLESFHVTHQMTYTPGQHQTLPYKWKDVVALMSTHTTSATFPCFPIRNSDIPSIPRHAWGNLTELSLKLDDDPSASPINAIRFAASVLRHCHTLISLNLIVWSTNNDASEMQREEDIILQHLKTLTISLPVGPAGVAFTKLLYLPSLNDLGFQFFTAEEGNSQELVQEMITSLLRASEDYHVLRVYTPYWASSSENLVQLLKSTPALRCLKIYPQHMDFGRWVPSHYRNPSQTFFRKVVNDSLLQALVSTDKLDSDIICPKLEVFISDEKLVTGITEMCLKDFLLSRKSDKRVSSLRQISVFVDEPKQQGSNTNKVSLSSDSAVYFKRQLPSPYSPFDGFKDDFITTNVLPIGSATVPSDCYKGEREDSQTCS